MAPRSGDHPQRILSLCSGIGALDYGLRMAIPTARTTCLVEGEAFSVACLVEAMRSGALDDCPVWSDARTFDGRPWCGVVDTVVAGFPCQPASVAGSRKGTGDARWLWDDIARILGEVEPAWVFLENVPGLLSAPGAVDGLGGGEPVRGGAVGAVLGALADLGYRWTYDLFRASDVGSTQRRERWFLLAHRDGEGREQSGSNGGDDGQEDGERQYQRGGSAERRSGVGDALVGNAHSEREQQPRRRKRKGGKRAGDRIPDVGNTRLAGVCGRGDAGDVLASTGSNQSEADQRKRDGDAADGPVRVVGVAHNAGQEQPGRGRQEYPQPWPPGPQDDAGWEVVLAACPWLAPALPTEPAVCLLADGDTVVLDPAHRIDRLRALGNSVVPECVALAYRVLRERLEEVGT